jgi:NADH-quinone oxidoreductase subunit E
MATNETENAPTAASERLPKFSESSMEEFRRIQKRFPDPRMWLLPTVKVAQRQFGYLSMPVMKAVARLLDVPLAHVRDVATFYTLLYTEPVGRHVVQVCQTISCSLRGADAIVDHMKKRFDIEVNETTSDGKFTLQKVECLGACGTAPVVQIDDDYHENLTIEEFDRILDQLS